MKKNYYEILELDNFETRQSEIECKFKLLANPNSAQVEAYNVLTNKNTKDNYDLMLLNSKNKKSVDFEMAVESIKKSQDSVIKGLDNVVTNSSSIFLVVFVILAICALLFAVFH